MIFLNFILTVFCRTKGRIRIIRIRNAGQLYDPSYTVSVCTVRSLINIFIVEEAGGGQQQHCGGAQFDWPTVGTNEPVRPASQPAQPAQF